MHVTKTPLAGRKRRDPNTCVRNLNSCSETSLKHTGQGEGLLRVWQIGWVRPLLLSPPSENRAHVAQSCHRQKCGGCFSKERKQALRGLPGPRRERASERASSPGCTTPAGARLAGSPASDSQTPGGSLREDPAHCHPHPQSPS